MAFTTSDTFDRAVVYLYDSHPGQLRAYVRSTNEDGFAHTFGRGRHPTPEVGTQSHTDWLIIQRDMGIE